MAAVTPEKHNVVIFTLLIILILPEQCVTFYKNDLRSPAGIISKWGWEAMQQWHALRYAGDGLIVRLTDAIRAVIRLAWRI